jgi:hypothetical protein
VYSSIRCSAPASFFTLKYSTGPCR